MGGTASPPSLAQRAAGLLRERGLRVTAQRRALLELFLADPSAHPSAAQVQDRLRLRLPEVSRATVYKALDDLQRAGLLEALMDRSGAAVYGLRLTEHDHFVCTRCGRWLDVPAGPRPSLPPAARAAGTVAQVEVIYRGVCRDCQEGPTARGTRRAAKPQASPPT